MTPSVLRVAGVEEADVVIAASSQDDLNAALALVCQRTFGTRRVLARVDDPRKAASYGRLGIETVCPTNVVAGAFLDLVAHAMNRPVVGDR